MYAKYPLLAWFKYLWCTNSQENYVSTSCFTRNSKVLLPIKMIKKMKLIKWSKIG